MVQNAENVLLSKEEYDNIVISLMHEMVDEDPAPGIMGLLNTLNMIKFSKKLKNKLFGEGEEK